MTLKRLCKQLELPYSEWQHLPGDVYDITLRELEAIASSADITVCELLRLIRDTD